MDAGSPGTGLADPYPWPGKVLPESLVVLRETAELELGHGLLVRTRVHGSGRDGEQDAAAGSLVRRAREVEEREKGERKEARDGKEKDGKERSRKRKSSGGVKGPILLYVSFFVWWLVGSRWLTMSPLSLTLSLF